MRKKTRDEILKEMYKHGLKTGLIDGYVEPKPKKKTNNKK